MRNLILISGILTVAACAEASAPAPEYDQPLDGVAFNAFKSAMKADWLDKPFDVSEMPESVNAVNYQKSVEWNEKKLANDDAPRAYGALQKLDVDTCEWGALKQRGLPKATKERVTEPPAGAYLCNFTVHYRINPPHGNPYEVKSKGYFFQEDLTYVYAGKFRHPY